MTRKFKKYTFECVVKGDGQVVSATSGPYDFGAWYFAIEELIKGLKRDCKELTLTITRKELADEE